MVPSRSVVFAAGEGQLQGLGEGGSHLDLETLEPVS